MLLPVEIDISERSRKFYDGTYKITSDGFIDEAGEFRAFDCYDPAARAPTPLPPMFLEDDVEGESARPLTARVDEMNHTTTSSGQRTSSTLPTSSLQNAVASKNEADSPAEFTFASHSADGMPIRVLQGELLHGYDRERLLGKIEGVQLASRWKGTELSQAECYRICGIAYPEGTQSTTNTRFKRESASPIRPSKVKMDNSSSPLSDYPSDLSDCKTSKKKSKQPTPKVAKDMAQQTSKTESPSKRTTRRVAQKVVRKTPKKASAVPTIITLQQEGGGPRRRSTRNSQSTQ